MAAPTYSQISPANGATDADLDMPRVLWSPAPPDNSDPINLASLLLRVAGVDYPAQYLAQPAHAFFAFAEVGLFPNDLNVTVEFIARSIAGFTTSVSVTFDCRGPLAQVTSLVKVKTYAAAGSRGLAEFRPLQLTGEALGVAHVEIRPTVAAPPSLAGFLALEHRAGADVVPAHISATRQIAQLLAYLSYGVSRGDEAVALRALEATQGLSAATCHALQSLVASGYLTNAAYRGVGVTVPGVFQALAALGVGREELAAVYRALSLTGGDGVRLLVDLLDAILDEAR